MSHIPALWLSFTMNWSNPGVGPVPPHGVSARWLGVFLPALPLQAILRNIWGLPICFHHHQKNSPGSLCLDKMIVCTCMHCHFFGGPCCFPWVMLEISLRFLANWNASFHFQKVKHWDWDAFPLPKSIHIYFDFHPAH